MSAVNNEATTEASELEYYRQVEGECYAEYCQSDPVYQDIRYIYFVSKSKGRRKNGKQRLRRYWKEVELLSYRGKGFTLWHRFPFDTCATECLGGSALSGDAEHELINRIESLHGKVAKRNRGIE